MMLPEIEVANILSGNKKLTQLMADLREDRLDYEPIFTDTPDDSFIKASSAPWIRVTSITGDNAIYGDDARLFEYPRVQVDFWLPEDKLISLEKLQDLIYETLHDNGYERYYKDRYHDPDLDGCLMVTANFEGFRERNEE